MTTECQSRLVRRKDATDSNARIVASVRYPTDGWGPGSRRGWICGAGNIAMPAGDNRSRFVMPKHCNHRCVYEAAFPYVESSYYRRWEEAGNTSYWVEDYGTPLSGDYSDGTIAFPMSTPGSMLHHYRYDKNAAHDTASGTYIQLIADFTDWPSGIESETNYPHGPWCEGSSVAYVESKHRCKRVLWFERVTHDGSTFTNRAGLELNPLNHDYIMRPAGDHTSVGDIRFRPWGWTDGGPTGSPLRFGGANNFGHYSSPRPTPPAGVSFGVSKGVTNNADIPKISMQRLYAGFLRTTYDWNPDSLAATGGGLPAFIPAGEEFDLCIVAYVKYAQIKYLLVDSHTMPNPPHAGDTYYIPYGWRTRWEFLGIYGRAFIVK